MQIVQDCLANGCDYGATALKYNVDYKALVNWVGRYRAHGPAGLHDSRHSSEGTRRAKGRARAVAPMQRLVIVLDCLENQENYGAMAQKIRCCVPSGLPVGAALPAVDGWLGMNDRPAPPMTPARRGARVAPPMRTPQKMGGPVRGRAGRPARPAAPRRVQLVRDCKNFV